MVVFFVCVWIWGIVQPEASSSVLSIGMRPRRSTAVSLDPAITSHTPLPTLRPNGSARPVCAGGKPRCGREHGGPSCSGHSGWILTHLDSWGFRLLGQLFH